MSSWQRISRTEKNTPTIFVKTRHDQALNNNTKSLGQEKNQQTRNDIVAHCVLSNILYVMRP